MRMLAFDNDPYDPERDVKDHHYVSQHNPLPVTFGSGSGIRDAFGRVRISQPHTLFDSKQIVTNERVSKYLWDEQEVSGSGTTNAYSRLTASTIMGVAATTAGKRVRQTKQWFNYQAGKSQLAFITTTLNYSGAGAGIKRSVGLFTDDNGIFLTNDGGTLKLVVRSSTSGSAVDNEVNKASWNIDKMDGTGPSGIILDVTKSQILLIDFEWLGVGTVRAGFVIDGVIYYVHQFDHANSLAGVYMSSPNLPVRYEIINDGTGAAAEIEVICSSVISEGGVETTGVLKSQTGVITSGLSTGLIYPLIGVRKNVAVADDTTITMERISTICGSVNDACEWRVLLNPTIGGTPAPFWTSALNYCVEFHYGLPTQTILGGGLGLQIDAGFFTSQQPATAIASNMLQPGVAIDGTPDEWYLCAIPITNNISVRGTATWRESS